MRKMASVCTIKDLKPVPKTDNLLIVSMNENLYTVLGNKQMNLSVGDKVVYFEVDSLLPLEPCYEFLKARCYNDKLKRYRIKAMKMRGVYSFGLILKGTEVGLDLNSYNAGDDLTKKLNVEKFEPFDDRSPRTHKKTWKDPFMRFKCFRWLDAKFNKGLEDFPTYIIPKSDEENLWNHPEFFEDHKNDDCYISIKMEGKSVTCYWEKSKFFGKKFKVFGRNKSLAEPYEIKWFKDNIAPKMLDKKWHNVVLQGECCAPKVQGGIYKNGIHFYVYKIKDLETNSYLTFEQMKMYCEMHGLETVPIVKFTSLKDFKSGEELYKFTEKMGFIPSEDVYNIVNPMKNKNARHHEGIVVASCDRNISDWSFKVKSQEYMLGK